MNNICKFAAVAAAMAGMAGLASAQYTATVEARNPFPSFEGLGTTLAWWANGVGSWGDPARSTLVDALFAPAPTGLGLSYSAHTRVGMTDTNTLSHGASQGTLLAPAVAGKPLAMPEWGSAHIAGKPLSQQGAVRDFKPLAWVLWQPDWPTLMTIDYTNKGNTINQNYYIFANYTRYVIPVPGAKLAKVRVSGKKNTPAGSVIVQADRMD